MSIKRKAAGILAAALLAGFLLTGCSGTGALNEKQIAALNEITAGQAVPGRMGKISVPRETASKFPALKKVFQADIDGECFYVFETESLGYRSRINLLVVIDPKKDEVSGIKVLEQDETPVYGGDYLEKDWFAERFQGKKTDGYLVRTILEAENDNEIIQITGASVSSQAVVNGVNAAIGAYRELILGETAEPVELKVQGYITGGSH